MKRMILLIIMSVLIFNPFSIVFANNDISVDHDQVKIRVKRKKN